MYITAKRIYYSLASKKLLKLAFSRRPGYRLIVTGHSLGGGVASILSMMLEPYYPDLYCYAFSTPGCIFRCEREVTYCYSSNYIIKLL